MVEEKKGTKSNTFLKFDTVALILGFVVDTITILSIVLSLHVPDINKNLPNFINPALAFGLWILAIYVYFGFLRSVWDRHHEEKNFSEKFSIFLADDLLFSFRYPALLFPAIVALISLFWIASTDSSGAFLGITIAILLMGGIPFLFWLHEYVSKNKTELQRDGGISQEFKERVNKEWRFLSSQINELLAKQVYVDYDDLSAIATLWDVPEKYMNFALVQFAIKNPKKTKFASLYSVNSIYPVNAEEKVLINLETVKDSDYYYD